MEPDHFDAFLRAIDARRSRRAAAGLLGGLLALPALARHEDASAKRRKKKKKKNRKGNKNSNTPPACVPNCEGGARCNVADGCGGTCSCAAGSLCWAETCRACDVIHTGNDATSGEALRQRLAAPMNDDAFVYVCPGRYTGYFVQAGGNVVGAGDGADPTTNTILDPAGVSVPVGTSAVLAVTSGVVSRMDNIRVTGSDAMSLHGVHVPAGGTLSVEGCTVTGTRGFGGYGVNVRGTFNALDTTISGNGPLSPSVSGGGGMYIDTPSAVLLEQCRIVDNQAYTSNGGGITLYTGFLELFGTDISSNKALGGPGYHGGGLYSNYGNVTMNDKTRITGNSSSGTGGGIYRENREASYPITLDGATVSNNVPGNCVNVTGCSG
ncbi:MAG: hypothetical protein QM692_14615 [Thermomicrobiales bacterium]